MKRKLFNVVIYGMLFWSMLSAIYVTLPPNYQAMLPFMNTGTAIVGGFTTLLTGTGGLAVQHYLRKTSDYNADLNKALVDKVIYIIDEYKVMKDVVTNLTDEQKLTNKLIATELKTKLDNPMLTTKARELIEGVLDVTKE